MNEQQEWRQKWVEALRSGDYKQGVGALRNGDSYCCLGVLEDITGCQWDLDDRADRYVYIATRPSGTGRQVAILNTETRYLVGLRYSNGAFGYSGENTEDGQPRKTLSEQNDHGLTFNQIADIIESSPEGLFLP